MSQMKLHEELQHGIDFVDCGIELRVVTTDWGSIATLYRGGQPTKWMLWFFANGSVRIFKPCTETIPEVEINFDAERAYLVSEYLTSFIQRGWI